MVLIRSILGSCFLHLPTTYAFLEEKRKYQYCLIDITKTHLFKYIENFTTKKGKISDKNSDIFHISAQNIVCGYSLEPPRQGSKKYAQSMFLSRNKKNNGYPCKPQSYYIKVGFKGSKLYRHVFVMKTVPYLEQCFWMFPCSVM